MASFCFRERTHMVTTSENKFGTDATRRRDKQARHFLSGISALRHGRRPIPPSPSLTSLMKTAFTLITLLTGDSTSKL